MYTARALSAMLTVTLLAAATSASAQSASASDPPAAPAAAAAEDTNNADLAKKLSNPIADLVSLPFQFNWENGIGPLDQTRYILNVQPVMPFSLNKNVNMIVRVIAPVVSQPSAAVPGGIAVSGVSDLTTSFFFSPTRGPVIWGVGPVITVPSTGVPALGTEKWSAGPTAVVLKQEGGLTFGALANQVWSFAGNASREDVSQMFLQPFVSYTTSNAWTFTAQSESTANWQIDGDGRWNVPLNALVAKLSTFGTFPTSYLLGGGYFVVHPDNGATWKIRAAITILLPRKK